MERILFLDLDGVVIVSHETGVGYKYALSMAIVERIVRVCNATGAKIVLTSDLRRNPEESVWLLQRAGVNPMLFHRKWATPIVHQDARWKEIQAWLDECPVVEYAILDDRSELFRGASVEMSEHLVLCNNRHGFVHELEQRVVDILMGNA